MDEALALKRKLLGAKIVEQTVAESDTQSIKAENERLKAIAEQQQLRQAASPAANTDPWRDFLLEQMRSLQGQLADTQRQMSDQQTALLQERMQILQEQLARVTAERPERTDTLTHVKTQVEEARAIMELVNPSAVPPPTTDGESATIAAWTLRTRFEQERWLAERVDRKEERLEELRSKIALQEQELDLRRRHDERMDRFMTETVPKAIDIGQGLLTRLMAGQPAAAPVAAAQTAPAGVLMGQCQTCGATLPYRPEWDGVGCVNCGSWYTLHAEPSPTAPPESPEVQERPPHVRVAPQVVVTQEEEQGGMR